MRDVDVDRPQFKIDLLRKSSIKIKASANVGTTFLRNIVHIYFCFIRKCFKCLPVKEARVFCVHGLNPGERINSFILFFYIKNDDTLMW